MDYGWQAHSKAYALAESPYSLINKKPQIQTMVGRQTQAESPISQMNKKPQVWTLVGSPISRYVWLHLLKTKFGPKEN